jgi:XTP/dITP diphosphohydrolase
MEMGKPINIRTGPGFDGKESEDKEIINSINRILLKKRGYVVRMPKTGESVVAPLSGGMDSVVNIAMLLKEYKLNVFPFFINRNQSAYVYEKKAAEYYDRFFKKLYPDLYNGFVEIKVATPAAEYKDDLRKVKESIKDKHLSSHISYPARNSVIFLTGMEYAYSLTNKGVNIRTVFASHMSSDFSYHCSLTWTRITNLTMCQITNDYSWQFISIPIETEFGNYFDKDVYVRYAIRNRIPLEYTRSCTKNSSVQCGVCPSCWDRRRAFIEVGVKDPTEYQCETMPRSIPTYYTKIITLLTRNPRKKEALQRAIDQQNPKLDIVFDTKKIWLPEIQENDVVAVAKFAAEYGAAKIDLPAIKMDTGMFVKGLNGFPGAFVHEIDERIGVQKFIDMCRDLKDRSAYITTALAYCEPGKSAKVFYSTVRGEIVRKALPGEGSFIDKVFIPHHSENKEHKTMGEIRQDNPKLLERIWGNTESSFLAWLTKNRGS